MSVPLQLDLRIDGHSGQTRDEGRRRRARFARVGAFTDDVHSRHHEVIGRVVRKAGDNEVGCGRVRHVRIRTAAGRREFDVVTGRSGEAAQLNDDWVSPPMAVRPVGAAGTGGNKVTALAAVELKLSPAGFTADTT